MALMRIPKRDSAGRVVGASKVSLRARGSGSRIKYRLVDEYETDFGLPQRTSRPFSLRKLIAFLDSVKGYGADQGGTALASR